MALHETLMDMAVKRSFLMPSCEIYGTVSGFYDYGPVGCNIKHRIEEHWRNFMLRSDGFHEIESSLILPEIVLKASGHAANFADPLITCTKCKNKFRADHLITEKTGKSADGLTPAEITELITKNGVKCPQCGGTLDGVGWFNLMFRTNIGPIEGNTAFCRPETAQGIFLDFLRLYRNHGTKLPLAVGQIGRSFRNEISPRQGLIRMREFTQMEIEYFFNPKYPTIENFGKVKDVKMRIVSEDEKEAGKESGQEAKDKGESKAKEMAAGEAVEKGVIPNEIMAYFMAKQTQFYLAMGIPYDKFFFRKMPKKETPHYSRGNFDLEVETSYGNIETIGNAYRTDYDLKSHAEMSKQDLSVFIEEEKAKIIPHVVEPSMGVDRLFWCVLEHCFRPKTKEKDWEWFDFPPLIAPYDAAVFPLMKKDGLAEKADGIAGILRESGLIAYYSESGSIGRRYARADEIGVPYCVTIDYDTLKDESVTLRFRNDGEQVRVKIGELAGAIASYKKEGKVKK